MDNSAAKTGRARGVSTVKNQVTLLANALRREKIKNSTVGETGRFEEETIVVKEARYIKEGAILTKEIAEIVIVIVGSQTAMRDKVEDNLIAEELQGAVLNQGAGIGSITDHALVLNRVEGNGALIGTLAGGLIAGMWITKINGEKLGEATLTLAQADD